MPIAMVNLYKASVDISAFGKEIGERARQMIKGSAPTRQKEASNKYFATYPFAV